MSGNTGSAPCKHPDRQEQLIPCHRCYTELRNGSGCSLAGPGSGDCEHFVGLPGLSMPGQHDGKDDTVDAWGKPNGWCWSCWKSKRISNCQADLAKCREGQGAINQRYEAALNRIHQLEAEKDGAIERSKIVLKYKDEWADKCRSYEKRITALEAWIKKEELHGRKCGSWKFNADGRYPCTCGLTDLIGKETQ